MAVHLWHELARGRHRNVTVLVALARASGAAHMCNTAMAHKHDCAHIWNGTHSRLVIGELQQASSAPQTAASLWRL